MREIEIFRCWSDNTWDTDFIEIPDDTLESDFQDACEKVVYTTYAEIPCMVGIYNIPEEVE